VIEKSLEVGCNSSQYPENWIFHSREKKPGKAFVEGKKIDFITVGGRVSPLPIWIKLNISFMRCADR
jgi:formamidopyrimidine-DNA glycosylase